jgi:hypothetical protein
MAWHDKPLVGENIFTHMRHMYELEHQKSWYFRGSKLFRAIVDHIADPNKECVLIHRPLHHRVQHYRGTGAAISLKDVGLFAQTWPGNGQPPIEPEIFWIKIEVDWWNEEYESEDSKTYNLNVPTALEVNFEQDKFNEWVAKVKEESYNKETVRHIQELVKKLPDCAERSEIMKQMDSIRGIKRS